MRLRHYKITGFAAGFFLLVNFQFPPGMEQGIRVTDYAGMVAWMAILFQLVRHRGMPRRILLRGLLLMGFLGAWLVVSVLSNRTLIDPLRWILGLGTAAGVLVLLRSPARSYFLRGVVLGAVGQVVVLLLQIMGFLRLTILLGLTAPDTDFLTIGAGQWRPPGMFGTNATPAVAALGIPAGLALLDEGRGGKRWVFLAAFAVLGTCAMTLTRSAILVVSSILIVWGAIKTNNAKRVGVAALVIMTIAGGITIVGPPGGWERWEGVSLESSNAQVRIRSTVESVELAFENPLGIGRMEYSDDLQQRSGSTATHNALSYIALAGNLPLALCLFFYFSGRGLSVLRQRVFEGWLALTMLGLCMWEEYFRNPVFAVFGIVVVLVGMYQRHDGLIQEKDRSE